MNCRLSSLFFVGYHAPRRNYCGSSHISLRTRRSDRYVSPTADYALTADRFLIVGLRATNYYPACSDQSLRRERIQLPGGLSRCLHLPLLFLFPYLLVHLKTPAGGTGRRELEDDVGLVVSIAAEALSIERVKFGGAEARLQIIA